MCLKMLTVELCTCHVGQKVCVCLDLIEVLLAMALGSTLHRDLSVVAVAASAFLRC